MAEEERNEAANQTAEGGAQQPANQTPEGGAQEETANQPAQGGAEQDEGLKAGLVAEQKKRQEAEQRARDAEMAAQYLQQQIQQFQQPQSQEPEIPDDEYVQYGQVRQEMDQRINQVVQSLQDQQFQAQNPDHQELLGSVQGRAFQPSDTFKELVASNPGLQPLVQAVAMGNVQAKQVAYQMTKQHKELQELRKATEAAQAQANVQQANNVTAPMSPAAAGGVGGGQQTVPEALSPEFDDFFNRVKAGEFDAA